MASKLPSLEEIRKQFESIEDEEANDEFEEMLYARHVEIKDLNDLEKQHATPIPALFNQYYKFVQNPSSVSVETFKRMIDTDDTIGSGTDFLTTCLAARLGAYQHASPEITEFVNKALEQVEGGWLNVVKEVLSATWAGFSVSEKVWANTELGFVPKKIVTLPPSTMLFETTRTGELTNDGILQYQRNWNPFISSRGTGYFGGTFAAGLGWLDSGRPDVFAKLGDLPFPLRTANFFNYLSIRIPRQKCLHYAFDAQGKFGNPYGRSLLRRAYKYYTIKDTVLRMMVVALDRKGTALTVVYSDPNTTLRDPDKTSDNSNQKGMTGKGIRADVAAQKAFKNVHNDTVIFLPGKKGEVYDVEFMPQSPNTADFLSALDFCNKSILRALLIPSLIFGNGDGTGSFSLGQEHAKTFDKILDGWLAGFKTVVLQQLIKELLAYNFPRSAWEKDGLGDFGKRQLSQDEIQKEMDVIEKGINLGIIDTQDLGDLNVIREKMGMEPLDKVPERDDMMGNENEDPEANENEEDKKPEPGEEG